MRARHFYTLLSATTLLVPINAAGWTLDRDSCPDPKIQQDIRDTMKWVFDQADDAYAELNKNPMDEDVQKLYGYLWPSDPNPADPQSTMSKVKRVYQTIAGMRQEQPKNPYDDSTAIIYCSLKRLTNYKPNPKKYELDTDLNLAVDIQPYTKDDGTTEDPKKLLDAIRSSNPWKGGDEARTKAFTISRGDPGDQPDDPWTYYASQVTIAPWYGVLAYGDEFDQSKGFKIKNFINRRKAIKEKWMNREIDFLSDVRSTLFHEMVHTRAVAAVLGLQQATITDDRLGYGWNNIMKGPQSSDNAPALLNADTYAYFALVISLMKDPGQPQTVDRYGSLVALAQALQRLVRRFIRWVA